MNYYLPLAVALVGLTWVAYYAVSINSPLRIVVPFYNAANALPFVGSTIEVARDLVCVKGGELDSKFWSNEKILAASKRTAGSGAHFRILFGPKLDARNAGFYRYVMENSDKFAFRRLRDRLTPHFMTVDDTFLGWESPHDPLQQRTGAVGRNRRNALGLRGRFDREWAGAEEFPLVDVLERITAGDFSGVDFDGDVDSPDFGFITADDNGWPKVCNQAYLQGLSKLWHAEKLAS